MPSTWGVHVSARALSNPRLHENVSHLTKPTPAMSQERRRFITLMALSSSIITSETHDLPSMTTFFSKVTVKVRLISVTSVFNDSPGLAFHFKTFTQYVSCSFGFFG